MPSRLALRLGGAARAALLLALPAAAVGAQTTRPAPQPAPAAPRSATAPAPAAGSAAMDSVLLRRMAELQRQLDSLRQLATHQQAQLAELDMRTRPAGDGDDVQQAGSPLLPSGSNAGVTLATRGVYGKPFVHQLGDQAIMGGWADLEYSADPETKVSVIDQHRLVPFVIADVTERLRVGAQVRFEHGAQLQTSGASAGGVSVEFATLDYRVFDALSLRGGVILSPMGRFNLLHDSPLSELTARPLVAEQVVPGTLSEAGVGAFGSFPIAGTATGNYEVYMVNGFTDALLPSGGSHRLTVSDAMVGTRGETGASTKNVVGRIAVSPYRNLEIGGSVHWGPYGDGTTPIYEAHDAMLVAADGAWRYGPVGVEGQWAMLHADLPAAVAATGAADGRQAWYVQGSARFGRGWLPPSATSAFTGAVRWEQANYATGLVGDAQHRLTAGLNWRPARQAALKGEYQFNWFAPEGSTLFVKTPGRVLLSLATYF